MIKEPWSKNPSSVLKFYNTNVSHGLTTEQVEDARKIHGYNELKEEEKKSLFALVLEQFEDSLVQILLGAAVISFILAYFEEEEDGDNDGLGAFIEPAVILVILIINAIVEYGKKVC